MARARPVVKARIEAEDRASATLAQTQSRFTRFTNGIKANFLKITAAAAAVVAAFKQVEASATLESQTAALKRNLASQGQSFDAFIAQLDRVAQGTVSTSNLIKASSQALLLGIPADKISELLEVARASAIATGTSITQAFNDIVTGIGRASPLILDNLGITVKLGDAYQAAAEAAGKTTEQLSEQEKKQALLNQVLEVGKERVELFGDAQTQLATAIQQGNAQLTNFKDALGKGLSAVVLAAASLAARAAQAYLFLAENIALAVVKLEDLTDALPFVNNRFEGAAQKAADLAFSLAEAREKAGQMATDLSRAADQTAASLLGLGNEAEETSNSMTGLRDTAAEAGAGMQAGAAGAEALQDGLAGTAAAADLAADEIADLAVQEARAASQARNLNGANRQLAASYTAVGQSALFANAATGGAVGSAEARQGLLPGRTAQTQGLIDASIQAGNRPFLGGTRIRLIGGGSRLIRVG